jgi:hypothetical protein
MNSELKMRKLNFCLKQIEYKCSSKLLYLYSCEKFDQLER